MKQIEAVDYVETTVELEQRAFSDSDSESDLTWLLSVTRCRATYMLIICWIWFCDVWLKFVTAF